MQRSYLIENKPVSEPIATGDWPKYDVIVAGLGTAGAFAALAAARAGLKVLGIERLTYVGGTSAGGGIWSYYYGHPGGLFEQTDVLVKEEGLRGWYIGNDLRKVVLERQLEEAGVELRYEASITAVLKDGNRVRGLEWTDAGGIQHARCRYLIEATADGLMLAMAGCPFKVGRESDGEPQPYSSVPVFVREGVRVSSANFDAGLVDPSDPDDLSYATIHGGRLYLYDSFEEASRLLWVADLLGLREGRLAVGEDTVRFSDFLNEKKPRKPVLFARSNHDSHTKDWAFESEASQDWIMTASFWGLNFEVPIPMGALIPKGVDGLLIASRCLAVDHDVSQSVRMQKDMQKLGEVAALMAAAAIEEKCDVRKIQHKRLLKNLRRSGCYADWQADSNLRWLTDPAQIRTELASHRPGIAIWSCRRMGNKIRADLRKWVKEPDGPLRRHSALALGLLRDPSALPVLREMAREPDPFVPMSSRNLNQPRGLAAICLLGIYRDAESLSLLLPHLASDDFQLMTHALTALIRVGEAHPKLRPAVAQAFRARFEDPGFKCEMPMKGGPPKGVKVAEPMHNLIRLIAARTLQKWKIEHRLQEVLANQPLTFREKRLLRQL